MASRQELIEVLFPGLWIDEIFNLHLIKFTRAENEIAWRNLITKSLPLLCNTKRQIRINRINDILIVRKDTLRGLGTKVSNIVRVSADISLEHAIKLLNVRPIRLTTIRTLQVKSLEFFCRNVLRNLIGHLIGTKTIMALFAFHERIIKGFCVARRLPDLRIHNNRRVHAIHIFAILDPVLPPGVHDFLLQSDAEWAKIPRSGHTAIDVWSLPNKTTSFAKANNIFHFCHIFLLSKYYQSP